MIPKIIHQTWKSQNVPDRFAGQATSWKTRNPRWQYVLWTNRMLLDFVAARYPQLLAVYCAYLKPVQRADAARYMLLHHFGGIYADLDTECLAPCDDLEAEDRVVLCHEPPSHWPAHAPYRGHPFILFNGVMASPQGHRFWNALLDRLPETATAPDVLDATGPCFLTGLYQGFDVRETIRVEPCHLFTPTDRNGTTAALYGGCPITPIARHDWAGLWRKEPRHRGWASRLGSLHLRAGRRVARQREADPRALQARIDRSALSAPVPDGSRYALLVPVRDAVSEIDPFFAALAGLDIPAETTKLVFCEGDSSDGTWEKLKEAAARERPRYRDILLLQKPVGTRFERSGRHLARIQRPRRSGLARVRNHLIDHGLDETDDWALWIDIDVWRFPADILRRLREARARIVVPNCVTRPCGPSFDLGSFVSNWDVDEKLRDRYDRHGLFQPPSDFGGRLYLSSLRHSDRVELDSVGGTMLLVDARLHRGGLRFPEEPYRGLIETEGFGALAKDLGVRPVGLPRLEVLHVPY
jgi:hypothetical protein